MSVGAVQVHRYCCPVKKYFVEGPAPTDVEAAATLWNSGFSADATGTAVLLEQYKLYVEMADRVSGRRALANTFFLTLNTAVFAGIGVLWAHPPDASAWLGVFPLIGLVVQCLVWFWTIRSYRQLNSAKWAVVGAIEQRLPASPWWRSEWTALGQGRDPARYWPLSHIEQWVPWIFALAYVGGFTALVIN